MAAATVDVDLLLGSDKEDGPFPQPYWMPSTTVEITVQQKRWMQNGTGEADICVVARSPRQGLE
jgi:hypothetical protein